MKSYERFLFILSKYGDNESFSFHPTPIIDLMWHAHICNPVSYKKDIVSICGKFFDHFPPTEKKSNKNYKDLDNNLWKKEFGCDLELDHKFNEINIY